ncbi:hypothetical protein V6N13_072564 [Hibiscus sabdariffa]
MVTPSRYYSKEITMPELFFNEESKKMFKENFTVRTLCYEKSSPKATLTDYMGSMVAMRNTSSSPNLLRSTKPPLWRPALCKVARGSSPQQLALTSWATLIAREARERGKAKGCSSTPGVKIEKVGPSTEMP